VVLNWLSRFGKKLSGPFLAIILLFQVIAAVIAYSVDLSKPFSNGNAVVHYLKENKMDTIPMVGAADFVMSPICTYLDRKIYYPEMKKEGSFCIWSKERQDSISYPDIFKSICDELDKGRNELLFIKSDEIKISPDRVNFVPLERAMLRNDVQIDFLIKFDEAVVKDENYFIYQVKRVDSMKVDYSKYPRLF